MIKNLHVTHFPLAPWQVVEPDRTLRLVLRVASGMIQRVECLNCDPCDTELDASGAMLPRLEAIEVPLTYNDSEFEYYVLKKRMETHKLRYHFVLYSLEGTFVLDERGVTQSAEERLIRPFFVSFVFDDAPQPAPAWAKDMIWYQIFPDRFRRGAGKANWNSDPITDRNAYFGGDLKGIRDAIPYLKKLGVTGVYLNPIFAAGSVHRYDTIDYRAIDPGLGTEEDFVRLCDALHENGMRIMLDGVFNHGSWKSLEFQDVAERSVASPYLDWFKMTDPDAVKSFVSGGYVGRSPYNTFAFAPDMPKWNTQNPAVAEHLMEAAEYWTKRCAVDAWRLDVPDEIHPSFLREFHARMKQLNPNLYIIGEIWSDPTRWMSEGLFDGVMNYPVYFAIRDFFLLRSIDAVQFCDRLTRYFALTPESWQEGMFQFCSTHDIPRILWYAKGNRKSVLNCYQMSSLFPGGISVYYGDEQLLSGGFDPDNRRCMPWNRVGREPFAAELFEQIHLLRRGRVKSISPINDDSIEIRLQDGQLPVCMSR